MWYRALLLCLTLVSWQLIASEDNYNYKLGAGDKINIKVYGEEDLSMTVLLDTSGSIDYPYLGEINVVGFTPAEIKQAIYRGLKGDYLIDPKVMVSITDFRQFYIKGEVNKPGGYPFQPGLTVDKAVALAGGFTERAAKQSIMLSSNKSGNAARKVSLSDNVHPDNILNIEQSFF